MYYRVIPLQPQGLSEQSKGFIFLCQPSEVKEFQGLQLYKKYENIQIFGNYMLVF